MNVDGAVLEIYVRPVERGELSVLLDVHLAFGFLLRVAALEILAVRPPRFPGTFAVTSTIRVASFEDGDRAKRRLT